jgi:hypothetical protein
MDGTAIVAGVLGGCLPDEAHADLVAQFWEHFPQFEHMRSVVEVVVAERRATASLHAMKILDIRDKRKAERDAVWDALFKTLLVGYDGTQEAKDACDRRLEHAKLLSKEILDAEDRELCEAYCEDTEDFKRCYKFLVWHRERETMKPQRRCA